MNEFARITPSDLKALLVGKLRVPCAYILRHKDSGRFYIGSTGNMRQRLERHLRDLNKGIHHNTTLQGLYSDESGLMFDVFWSDSRDEVLRIEQSLLDKHHGGEFCLNLGDAAVGAWKVVHDHIRKAISSRRKGVATTPKGKPRTDKEKLAISIATRAAVAGKPGPNLGKPLSDETKCRLSLVKSIPCSIKGVSYSGATEAADKLNMSRSTLVKRLISTSDQFADWFFTDREGKQLASPRPRPLICPL